MDTTISVVFLCPPPYAIYTWYVPRNGIRFVEEIHNRSNSTLFAPPDSSGESLRCVSTPPSQDFDRRNLDLDLYDTLAVPIADTSVPYRGRRRTSFGHLLFIIDIVDHTMILGRPGSDFPRRWFGAVVPGTAIKPQPISIQSGYSTFTTRVTPYASTYVRLKRRGLFSNSFLVFFSYLTSPRPCCSDSRSRRPPPARPPGTLSDCYSPTSTDRAPSRRCYI